MTCSWEKRDIYKAMIMRDDICALVLAAGKGTRMKGSIPKVLYGLLGEPILWYVHRELVSLLGEGSIFYVLGYKREMIESSLEFVRAASIYQERQLGTGDAFRCAYPLLREKGYRWCLVVNGDVPFLEVEELKRLLELTLEQESALSFLSIVLEDPTGYGRVIRDESGMVLKVVEEKDIERNEERLIKEVNAGIYVVDLEVVGPYLERLSNDNAQGEYYLPDLISLFLEDDRDVLAVKAEGGEDFLGINTCRELIRCDEILRSRIVEDLLDRGVVIYNPQAVRIGPRVDIAPGVILCGPVELYGDTLLQEDVRVESHVWMKDVEVGRGAHILGFSHLEGASIGAGCIIGPFARIRPGTVIDEGAKVGNFVEIKKSHLFPGVKASHLSYLGDSEIGEGTNIGAGTITCNYDGKRKHKTVIGRDVFVGSNTSLVAPLNIGEGALIGAGSTITRDVPEGCLSVARARQKNLVKKRH